MKIIRINAMWCSGCLSMKKIWKEIESEYGNCFDVKSVKF